jgi:hypothetical protein
MHSVVEVKIEITYIWRLYPSVNLWSHVTDTNLRELIAISHLMSLLVWNFISQLTN